MISLFSLFLMFSTPAMAQDTAPAPVGESAQLPTVDTNCPPDCTPGTPQHDAWWCGTKTVQTDCEAKDKVNCAWVNDQCQVKP